MISDPRESVFAGEAGSVWHPTAEQIAAARVTGLLTRTGEASIPELHARSINEPEWYWREVVADLGLHFSTPFDSVLDLSEGKPFPRWFNGGTINVSENCTDRAIAEGLGDREAIRYEDERGNASSRTYHELHAESVAFARYLRSIGIAPGDRVGLYLPMCPEAAAALLGCARVGAVAVTAFSGYGADAVGVRMRACGARALVCASSFVRKDRDAAMLDIAREAASLAPSIERLIVLTGENRVEPVLDLETEITWSAALASPAAAQHSGDAEALDPNHPMLIIYTSGTTGEPKGIVHSQGGFLTKVAHDWAYCLDVGAQDTMFWIVDLGWVVGPLVILGGLFLRSRLVFFEGVPNFTAPDQLWDLIERHQVSVSGLSPTAVRTMMASGEELVARHDLTCLRIFATAGEPWSLEAWQWLHDVVGQHRIPLINYSGGTEISGGILTCYPTLPIAPCGFSGPVLGMDADVCDATGAPLRGEIGELVVRQPWPGMTIGFWNDPERYLATYWGEIPGVWAHGDSVLIDEHGYWHIRGRSDDTIMVAGKRIGPAEVEAAIIAHPEVDDAAAVGVPDALKGEHIAAFVTCVNGQLADDRLAAEIRQLVAARVGPTLVPTEIVGVAGFPKTRTSKIMRRLIRARYLGQPTGDVSGLEDMTSLDLIPVKP